MDRHPWHTETDEERIMTLHQLKIEPKWLDRLLDGSKTAEVRRHDRDFQLGDSIEFLEWIEGEYGPRSATAVISHVLPGQQVDGVDYHYCVLSLCEIQKVGK